MQTLKQVYSNAVAARLSAQSNRGWGGKDSLAVIEALTDWAYGESNEGFDPVRESIGELVNPSAFRQKLEGNYDDKAKAPKTGVGSFYIIPGEKKGKSGSTALSLLAGA